MVCAKCQLNVELAKTGHLDTVAAATAALTADVDAAASADIAMEIVRQGEVKVSSWQVTFFVEIWKPVPRPCMISHGGLYLPCLHVVRYMQCSAWPCMNKQ